MIFSPGRINITGEHTDYNEGYVFPAAVNKGIVAAIQKSDSEKSVVYAVDKEQKVAFHLSNLRSSSEGTWLNYILGVVAELQNSNKVIGNFNNVFGVDIPEGAGMSSSAALENSEVFGLNELFDPGLSKEDMILISQKATLHVVGARMMGGGFGGCTINLIAKDQSETFTSEVSMAYKNKFDIDCSVYSIELSDGTSIIS